MMPQIPQGGAHHHQAQFYGGVDAYILPLIPRPLRLRIVAWKILRHLNFPRQFEPGAFTFSLPGETLVYEITDTSDGGAWKDPIADAVWRAASLVDMVALELKPLVKRMLKALEARAESAPSVEVLEALYYGVRPFKRS